jgi:hypothetical protein
MSNILPHGQEHYKMSKIILALYINRFFTSQKEGLLAATCYSLLDKGKPIYT